MPDPAVIPTATAPPVTSTLPGPSGPDVARRAPYGNPVVGERGGEARRRILAATLEVLRAVGYDDLRIDMVTERAGCSRPTFYQYFASKEDVFWSLARRLGREMVALAGTLPRVTPDRRGMAVLTEWVSAFLALHDEWAPVFAEFPLATLGHEGVVAESRPFSSRTAEALVAAFGLPDEAGAVPAMRGMVAVLMRVSFYAESGSPAVRTDAYARSMAGLLHRMFLGPIEGVNARPGTEPSALGRRPRRVSRVTPPAPRPRTTLSARSEQTRERLLAAGLAHLRSRGFRATSVDDVTAAARVSHGTFYRYFANMEELVLALAEVAGERTRLLLEDFRWDADGAGLRAWLDEWFATYQGHGGIISVWQERPSNAALTAYSTWVAAAISARLAALLQQGDSADPAADAIVLLAVLERLPYTVFTLEFLSRQEGIDTAVLALRRGFLAAREEAS